MSTTTINMNAYLQKAQQVKKMEKEHDGASAQLRKAEADSRDALGKIFVPEINWKAAKATLAELTYSWGKSVLEQIQENPYTIFDFLTKYRETISEYYEEIRKERNSKQPNELRVSNLKHKIADYEASCTTLRQIKAYYVVKAEMLLAAKNFHDTAMCIDCDVM